MKHLTMLTGVVCLIVGASSAFSQPKFSLEQMHSDFDFLTGHLKQFAVHMDINVQRYNLDYDVAFMQLRQDITPDTSPCEFKNILKKASNLVQDGHCNFMGYEYLSSYGQYQDKFNFKDDQTYDHLKYYEDQCDQSSLPVLPVAYIDGSYYVYADFTLQADTVYAGTEIREINSQAIHEYLLNNLTELSPMRWDETRNRPYQEYFYYIGKKEVDLTMFRGAVSSTLHITSNDSIQLVSKQANNIEYMSQSNSQVMFLEDTKSLYIGLSFMTRDNAKQINHKVDSILATHQAVDVILDIRGNPGGNDQAWRDVLKNLISTPLMMESDLKFRYGNDVIQHYKSKKDPTAIELLNGAPYWDYSYTTKQLKPSKKGHKIEGHIYILQDEYIFSSAGNLAMLAQTSDQLISAGISTGLIGGAQTNPLFFKLPHSELIFRLEPMLDFSHVEKLSDFNHNQVELPLEVDYHYYEKRYASEKKLYSKDFLLQEDDMFSQLIELIITSKNDKH